MEQTPDILSLVKLLEVEKQADSTSASSKYIINDIDAGAEQPLYLKNINKSLDLIIKRLLEREKESQSKETDKNQKPLGESKPRTSKQTPVKLSSILTEVEKQRYKSIFEILGSTLEIGKFQKGPEANRLQTQPVKGKGYIKQVLPQATKDIGQKKTPSFLEYLTGLALAYNTLTDNVSGTLQSAYRVLKNSVSKIVETGKNLYNRFSGIGNMISRQFSKLSSGIGKIFNSFKSTFKTLIDDIVKSIGGLIPTSLLSRIPGFKNILPPTATPRAIPGPVATPAAPRAGSIPSGQAWYSKIPGAKTVTKVAEKIKTNALEPALKILRGIFPAMGGAKGVLKGIGKAMNNPIVRKIPVVAPLLEVFFGRGDIEELKKKRASNEIKSDEELYRLAGQRVIKGVGGLLGGAAGALVLSGLPVLGTLAGGLVGDILGRLGADVVTNYLLPQEATMDIGKVVVGGEIKAEELQDFLVKGDRVYKFNNKDEVLGMKEGGAVNNLISSITTTNEKQFSISSRQVKILEEIRDGIRALVSKEVKGVNNNYGSNRENNSRPSLTPFTLRSEFNSMNNIATI